MKSELKETKLREYTFPALYTSLYSSLVVLFESIKDGMVVVADQYYPIGTLVDWSSAPNGDLWQRLPLGSQVILTQD